MLLHLANISTGFASYDRYWVSLFRNITWSSEYTICQSMHYINTSNVVWNRQPIKTMSDWWPVSREILKKKSNLSSSAMFVLMTLHGFGCNRRFKRTLMTKYAYHTWYTRDLHLKNGGKYVVSFLWLFEINWTCHDKWVIHSCALETTQFRLSIPIRKHYCLNLCNWQLLLIIPLCAAFV